MKRHNKFLLSITIFLAVGLFLPLVAGYTPARHLAFMAFSMSVGCAKYIYQILRDKE